MDILSLKTAYLELSADQKNIFCDYALSLLHEKEEADVAEAWLQEARLRLEECDRNPTSLIPISQALAELRHGL